jgi:hypothetical protein
MLLNKITSVPHSLSYINTREIQNVHTKSDISAEKWTQLLRILNQE